MFYPDFTIRHPYTGEVFCISHGILPGIKLITTYETKEKPLSIETVENAIQE